MKSIFKSFVAVLALASVITVSSCTKTCDPGYEGTDCKTEMRTKFVHEPNGYTVTEDGTLAAPASYTIHIQTSTASVNTVRISGLWQLFVADVIATVDGNNITIARQEPDGDNYFVEGSGSISGSTITVSYKVTNETTPSAIITDSYGLGGGSASVWVQK